MSCYRPCKGTQQIGPFECDDTSHGKWTSQENLKLFLHGKDSKTKSHPVRLQALCHVIVLTTALARPQVDSLGIEFHEEDVPTAHVGVPIQGACCIACHPGISNVVHLRKDRQLSFAVLHRCVRKSKEQLREKPVRQGKNEVKINDNAKSLQMQKNYG